MNAPFRRRLVRQGVARRPAAESSRPAKLRILLRDKGVHEKRSVGRSDYAPSDGSRLQTTTRPRPIYLLPDKDY